MKTLIFKTGLSTEALHLVPTTKPIILKQLVSVLVFVTITVLLLTANAYSQSIGINDDGIAPPAGINVEIDFDKAGDATTKTWLLIDGDITTANQTANLTGLDINLSDGAFNSTATNIGLNVDVSGLTGGTNYAGIFMGGNVGIGTTTPPTRLSLEGDDQAISVGRTTWNYNTTPMGAQLGSWSGSYTNAAGLKLHRFTGGTNYRSAYVGQAQGAVDDWGIDFRTNSFGSLGDAVTSRMFISSTDGKIGIGTTVPEELLDIQGGDILLDNNQGIRIEKTGGFNKMVLELDDLDFTALHSGATGTGILFKDEADTEVARITTAGNMGIGTPDPIAIAANSMFTVEGEGKYGQITTITHSNTEPSGAFRLFGSRGTRLVPLAINSTDRFGFIVANGYDGDSYAKSASVEFYVDGTVSTVDLPSKISFWTTDDGALNRTEKMVIKNNGEVGIGTTTPEDILHVAQTSVGGLGPVLAIDNSAASTLSNESQIAFLTDVGASVAGTSDVRLRAINRNAANGAASFQIDTWDGTAEAARIYIKEDGNVGIGTTAPTSQLYISRGTGIAPHAFAQLVIDDDANNMINILSPTTGLGYLAFGDAGDAYIGGVIYDHNDNSLDLFANNATRLSITSTGRVGIGTLAPGGQFELSLDQGRKPATTTWITVSDERLKNIEGAYTKGLNEILQLQPITYYYKNVGERKFADEVLNIQNVGFSAQEVKKIFPEAVGTDEDGYLNFNMHAILVAYVNAIKELKTENDALKNKVAEIDVLKLELEAVKSIIEMQVKK
ncbi:MAG: hypothetical protein COA57_03105 [Flavobacteriales bacterium]|nr:MAG: hypothetical protein COA57_03105 [Flavobacteriales bacterium]